MMVAQMGADEAMRQENPEGAYCSAQSIEPSPSHRRFPPTARDNHSEMGRPHLQSLKAGHGQEDHRSRGHAQGAQNEGGKTVRRADSNPHGQIRGAPEHVDQAQVKHAFPGQPFVHSISHGKRPIFLESPRNARGNLTILPLR